ncbi:hypothetical protein MKW94_013841 [Papaver nudicaule]|uniref:Uncharacterized protein n=1 Tax=Papaver nudicaule TaxID=74823 RepID=A0AA41RLA9_PAPNU|nr:hypothetical protein [Papaver nudicaule]
MSPSVQASISANTWVVSGSPQTKSKFLFSLWIIYYVLNILRPDNLDNLRKLAEQFQRQMPGGVVVVPGTIPEDDDDVPDLVAGETFEAAAVNQH